MAVRDIVVVDNPVLRRKAKKVGRITPDIRRLIDDMVETMRVASGVGLAAPQVGASQRVIVVEYGQDEEEAAPAEARKPIKKKLYAVINPEIRYRSADRVEGVEGCLSIPGWAGAVERHAEVEVRGLNRAGGKFKLRATGWLARIFQHEIDHLDGILFTDRVVAPDKLWPTTPSDPTAPDRIPTVRIG